MASTDVSANIPMQAFVWTQDFSISQTETAQFLYYIYYSSPDLQLQE